MKGATSAATRYRNPRAFAAKKRRLSHVVCKPFCPLRLPPEWPQPTEPKPRASSPAPRPWLPAPLKVLSLEVFAGGPADNGFFPLINPLREKPSRWSVPINPSVITSQAGTKRQPLRVCRWRWQTTKGTASRPPPLRGYSAPTFHPVHLSRGWPALRACLF